MSARVVLEEHMARKFNLVNRIIVGFPEGLVLKQLPACRTVWQWHFHRDWARRSLLRHSLRIETGRSQVFKNCSKRTKKSLQLKEWFDAKWKRKLRQFRLYCPCHPALVQLPIIKQLKWIFLNKAKERLHEMASEIGSDRVQRV